MNPNSNKKKSPCGTVLTLCTLAMLAGCAALGTTPGAVAVPQDQAAMAGGKTGAELWAETCQRCHNFRSPGSLSDGEWEVALMHMRIRANLTGEEQSKILEFMKSGN